MAFSNIFGIKKQIIKVKTYSINQAEVLGQGAFGIVFKGSDAKKNMVAAKRIDGNAHPRVLTQDLYRLIQLDHPNVMKILDVERNENIVWMMMPLCEFGDLNHYCRTKDMSNETKIDGMKQIAAGIKYLHSEEIVHRDIKPGNILVVSEIPLVVQLTDFDVSKCLDPEVLTSLMTSNVGTLAFKVPEFFQRTSPGKIEYHMNVDIYAAGLTFLAILQAETKEKMLIPHIETPMDDSELHAPSIGLLIAERIKYKVSELNIVKVEGEQRSLKWLINQMTSIEPEKRLSAQDVLSNLEQLEPQCDADTKDYQKVKLATTLTLPQIPVVDVNAEGQLLVRVLEGEKHMIRVIDRLNGAVISEMTSMCNHVCYLKKHPTNNDSVLERCSECKVIRIYNTFTQNYTIVHSAAEIVRICDGPDGSILVLDGEGLLSKLKWDTETHKLSCSHVEKLPLGKSIQRICYVKLYDIFVVILSKKNKEIMAWKSDNCCLSIWELSGPVHNLNIDPVSLTFDIEGNVYVDDGANDRILKINSFTGKILRIFLLKKNWETIRAIFWSKTDGYLIVQRDNRISSYSFTE